MIGRKTWGVSFAAGLWEWAVDGHSATRIHPELQERNVGDEMVFHPPSCLAYTVVMGTRPESSTKELAEAHAAGVRNVAAPLDVSK
jgi:hypothetical protein